MKKLIRRLSRVSDSSQYCLLRSDSRSATRTRRSESFRTAKLRRPLSAGGVPHGHLPVYVGEEMERFIVSAEFLNHPVFVNLLNKSAQEYGYEQQGVLRIPCHVLVFERVLEALRLGDESGDLQELVNSECLWVLLLQSMSFLERGFRIDVISDRFFSFSVNMLCDLQIKGKFSLSSSCSMFFLVVWCKVKILSLLKRQSRYLFYSFFSPVFLTFFSLFVWLPRKHGRKFWILQRLTFFVWTQKKTRKTGQVVKIQQCRFFFLVACPDFSRQPNWGRLPLTRIWERGWCKLRKCPVDGVVCCLGG